MTEQNKKLNDAKTISSIHGGVEHKTLKTPTSTSGDILFTNIS